MQRGDSAGVACRQPFQGCSSRQRIVERHIDDVAPLSGRLVDRVEQVDIVKVAVRPPIELVRSRAAFQPVVARAAVKQVVAIVSEQMVMTGAPEQLVAALAAGDEVVGGRARRADRMALDADVEQEGFVPFEGRRRAHLVDADIIRAGGARGDGQEGIEIAGRAEAAAADAAIVVAGEERAGRIVDFGDGVAAPANIGQAIIDVDDDHLAGAGGEREPFLLARGRLDEGGQMGNRRGEVQRIFVEAPRVGIVFEGGCRGERHVLQARKRAVDQSDVGDHEIVPALAVDIALERRARDSEHEIVGLGPQHRFAGRDHIMDRAVAFAARPIEVGTAPLHAQHVASSVNIGGTRYCAAGSDAGFRAMSIPWPDSRDAVRSPGSRRS